MGLTLVGLGYILASIQDLVKSSPTNDAPWNYLQYLKLAQCVFMKKLLCSVGLTQTRFFKIHLNMTKMEFVKLASHIRIMWLERVILACVHLSQIRSGL